MSRRRHSRKRHDERIDRHQLESLEPRLLLSVAVAHYLPEVLPALFNDIRDQIVEMIPDDFRQVAEPVINAAFDTGGKGYSYQAFPGEVNDVRIWGELGNTLLLTNESNDVTIFRLGTFSFDPIEKIEFKPEIKIEGGGSFVGHLAAGLGLTVDGVIDSLVKGWFDLAEPRVVALNGTTLLNLIPTAGDVLNGINSFLDFTLSDIIPNEITIIPPIYLFGKKVWGGWTVQVPSFLQNLPTVGDVLSSTMPQPVADLFDQIDQVLEWLKARIISDGVYVSTLDGPDRIDLSRLTGIPQTVHGDYGDDVILAGGGQDRLDSWGIPFRDQRANREIELYGEEGNDTIILNNLYDSKLTLVDGGPGSDRMVVQGTDASDIIRLISGPDGALQEIRLEIPNPLAAEPSNEVQRFRMPSAVDGGSFVIEAEGWGRTDPLAWNASALAVEVALAEIANRADPALTRADIKVTGGGDRWDIEFLNKLAGRNFTPLIIDGANLERNITAAEVSVERDGGDGGGTAIANEVQKITLPDGVTGGTFTLQFDTWPETGPIAYQSGVRDVRIALLRTGMPADDFEVTGDYGVAHGTSSSSAISRRRTCPRSSPTDRDSGAVSRSGSSTRIQTAPRSPTTPGSSTSPPRRPAAPTR